MRVLVVDHDESFRGVVLELLNEVGCESVSFAPATEVMRDCSRDHDLILLDLDSAAAARVRRRLETLIPPVPVVTVSDGHYEATVETALAVLRAAKYWRTKREKRLTARMHRLEKSNTELLRIVCVDPLTGLANRRHFDEILSIEWSRAARSGAPLSLAMLDLDYFHALNERYGHPGGDECLKRVADSMGHCLRRPTDVVARYGGEEFVALLPDTDAAGAYIVAERLRAHVEHLQLPHETSLCNNVVTLSAGVATIRPTSDQSCDPLVATADVALYRAKHEGRNRVCADAVPPTIVVSRPAVADPSLPRSIARLFEARNVQTREGRRMLDFARVSAIVRTAIGLDALADLGEGQVLNCDVEEIRKLEHEMPRS